ncbi:immunity protein Tsi6 family protein [Delftia tsuruhatensis]|uniref:immunity protein Tsi6 family protein n=1 Tax=Delftia tsuruhatensis TaxID=180282 RepID=UPI002445278A|nr:immunity protein Tsi6 family protein [Delftia tsuruhatensis]MDH0772438.1 immunity protein Tsi6 family protein [Delftia tsuruhatensis]MDH1457085.1 immunity protein Tsi6 family protein [Delftia tsuruhatensis]MDH1821882.1 immunity protein Tsi6 family protein [Delftia tsuruhatensis]WGG08619.1 immunity protein Tsi6 family protein [Delftia tsuruhatensis]
MTPLEYIDRALALVAQRALALPGHDVFQHLTQQLQYVRAVLLDRGLDRSRLHQITIGSMAVKEFDETDPELARALKHAHYVAVQTGRGLKIDLP